MKDTRGLLSFIANHDYRLLGQPGQYVSYSNDAYGLLGSIIELVSGKNYEEYLQDNILGPLNMGRTTTRVDKMKKFPELTCLYSVSYTHLDVYKRQVYYEDPLNSQGTANKSSDNRT